MDKLTEQYYKARIDEIKERLEEKRLLDENDDSDDLYNKFYETEDGNPNEDVEYENFIWNRKKSNDNITDTMDGK